MRRDTDRGAQRRAGMAFLVGVLLAGVAGVPAGPAAGTPADGAGTRPPATIHDHLMRVAGEVPSFAGVHVDGDGRLHLLLTDPDPATRIRSSAAAMAALSAIVDDRFRREAPRITPASHSYARLGAWFETLRTIAFPGQSGIGIDHARNRIVIGLLDPSEAAVAARIARTIEDLAIPADAVVVEPWPAVEELSSLRDRHRPLVGGLQISFPAGLYGILTGVCTLGFVAERFGVEGFVTNAHCSAQRGGTGTRYSQPVSAALVTLLPDSNHVATEIADPPFFTGGDCPSGWQCRYSDANFARLEGAGGNRGVIARSAAGSPAWGGSTFTVTGTVAVAPPQGARIDKVGRTTGWTFGEVQYPCVDIISTTGVRLLCQIYVTSNSRIVDSGDSGAPVFSRSGSADADLAGILWGGSSDGRVMGASPLSGIEADLGPLTVTAP